MDHIAIMRKSWGLIPKILSGEKTIESRWYQTKRAPWDKVQRGDAIFFKNSGEPISARAKVGEVLQFRINDVQDAVKIVRRYGKEIGLLNNDPTKWLRLPKYCILVRLENPETINPPFAINKHGFGISAAWIVIDNVQKIRI